MAVFTRISWWARILTLLAVVALAQDARAQDIAPGPMSQAHNHLKGPLSCAKCHEGGGVPDKKCLGCHDHRNLRARIELGKGFHANKDVKKKKCKDCHPEHRESPPGSGRGKKTTIDWRPFGGKRNFEHQRTGWPLKGAHRFEKCEACHKKRSPKTKLTIFLGLSGECTTCHKNPHEFADIRLNDCTICHNFNDRKVKNLAVTKFDHDKTKFPLEGRHLKKSCAKCHKKVDKFTVKDRNFSDCNGCHKDSHRSVISKGGRFKCKDCHQTKVKFPLTKFNHAKETGFPLRGQHKKNACKDCHEVGSKPEKPQTNCASCHKDIHEGRFGKETCEGCHVEQGWKEINYAHNKKTKFKLTGLHRRVGCEQCHRNRDPKGFERLPVKLAKDCAGCHEHAQAHCGQFGMENCQRCHVRGGDKTSRFDHNLTRFPLVGAHAKPSCDGCHKPARLGSSASCREAIKYTGLEPECYACHDDIHKGELGQECTKCHSSGRDFKTLVFDHNKDSRFALTGFHQLIECDTCHPKQKFKIDKFRCADCHADDDVHENTLGDDCAKCHETTGGAPKFEHNEFTDFDLLGVHRRVECQRCHFLPEPSSKKRKELMTAVAEPGAPLDLKFRVGGSDCQSCHPDPHQVRQEIDCGGCHHFEDWKAPNRNDYHERSGFSLTGAHTVLQCSLCHSGAGRMTGRGESCGGCHTQDDVHAGSLGGNCGTCHEQNGWLPTSFSHMTTGFVLEGIHRALDCRSCHQAGNYFIGRKCYHCHLRDYRESATGVRGGGWHSSEVIGLALDPNTVDGTLFNIGAANLETTLDCDQCHNQFSFDVSTYSVPLIERNAEP